MENATQALLIAGGVLLGILTIMILMNAFGDASIIANAEQREEDQKKLAAWNAEWEAYDKRLLYGAEVLTVVNKAAQNNAEYENDPNYIVEIQIPDKPSGLTNEQYLSDKNVKVKIFKSRTDLIEYNDETGRIKKMVFEIVE